MNVKHQMHFTLHVIPIPNPLMSLLIDGWGSALEKPNGPIFQHE